MSDLQCPATVVFVADDAAATRLPTDRFRVAETRTFTGSSPEALAALVAELSDEFRGECVAVVAPDELVAETLAGRGLPRGSGTPSAPGSRRPTDPGHVAVDVDSSGWWPHH